MSLRSPTFQTEINHARLNNIISVTIVGLHFIQRQPTALFFRAFRVFRGWHLPIKRAYYPLRNIKRNPLRQHRFIFPVISTLRIVFPGWRLSGCAMLSCRRAMVSGLNTQRKSMATIDGLLDFRVRELPRHCSSAFVTVARRQMVWAGGHSMIGYPPSSAA